jgi:hypothetical protein
MQSTGKCLKSNKVFTTQCLALNKVKKLINNSGGKHKEKS